MDYKTRRISSNIVSDDRPSYIFIAIPEQAVVSRAHFTLNFAQRSIHSRYMHLQTVAEQLINPIQALVRLCTLQVGMKTNQPASQTIWQLINNHCHTMTLPQHFIGPRLHL